MSTRTDLHPLPTVGDTVADGPDSGADLPAAQQPHWPDQAALAAAVGTLASYPPLVFAGECDVLKTRMASAGRGEAFVLQGGDCAETFAGATADNIRDRVKTILQMAAVLTYGASVPVVKVGRMAGQYGKPRSSNTETREGVTLPAYRGDMVNDFDFNPAAREPDPQRLVRGYHASSATLNLVRAFTTGGFADLRNVHDFDKAMRFMAACGADFEAMKTTEFFAAHEALLLDYERPLVRIDSRTGERYSTSGHFVWVGERTRDLDGAHIDFVSRIRNPVGVKVSANADLDDLLRMASGAQITWICDPMHGNTFESASGYKTRDFEDVVDEVRGFFEVHEALGTVPGGIHVELTGNDVTECLGGSEKILDADLNLRYESVCDPRLNHQQSLELAFVVAEMLSRD